jgi:SAM-dependent methyltransferase
LEQGSLTFTCNVCGGVSTVPRAALDRESATCAACGSSVRYRAIVHALSTALFGTSLPLAEFPERRDLRGVGLSDWEGYTGLLASKLGYRNTYYHAEPRLDLVDPPPELAGTLDFLVCSDVLEHVAPPVERAFRGAATLLAPGGVLVLTVPYGREGETVEHYPGLHEYAVVDFHGRPVVLDHAAGGGWRVFEDPVFHGGAGETLEMRIFSLPALLRHLEQAGFVDAVELAEDVERYGIVWLHPWSLPVLARRGPR